MPNRANGILVSGGASGNEIGGQATGGNDPTAGVFARPPQGNLISGNRGNGVLLTGGATANTLLGTTFRQDPFVFYNVLSGNRDNGLRIIAATDLLVGGAREGAGNQIVTSASFGLYATGNCARTRVIRNRITENSLGNVNISSATGITYVP